MPSLHLTESELPLHQHSRAARKRAGILIQAIGGIIVIFIGQDGR